MASAAFLWAKILSYMGEKYTDALVSTWFDDVDVVELQDNNLILHTPNPFRKPVLEKECIPYIQDAMLAVGNQHIQVTILDDAGLQQYQNKKNSSHNDLDPILKEFTFDNFVVGPSNQLAAAAAHAVVNHPAEAYNPLLIYGGSGLGKTHLLYAIANAFHEKYPDRKIVYVKSDQFTNELINAIKQGKNVDFRSKYRGADLFLMDDIQFIAGKDTTQEEFFHTFNTLYEQKKQIVLTSDRTPDSMSKLEERLKTRFLWGLNTDIQPPTYETRIAIIQKKAESLGLELPDDVVAYVGENVTSNVRQLEGTVNKILAYRDMTNFEINLANVSRAIKDMFRSDDNKILPTPQLVISEVASYYNLSESDIRGSARDKNTTEARQVSMYLIRNLTNLSFEDIAREYGKDHSTVMHSIEKIKNKLPVDARLSTTVNELQTNINGKR